MFDPSPIDGTLTRKKGLFGRCGVRTLMCVAAHPTDPAAFVTGTSTGQLLVWLGRNAVRVINAHEAAVTVVQCVANVGLMTGGGDNRLRVWFRDITPGAMFELRGLGSMDAGVRSLSWNPAANRILLATAACEIYELSDSDGSDHHAGPLLQGHFQHELHGLAVRVLNTFLS